MSSPIADGLFEALANGLWRGGLLVIVAALLLRFFKRTTAAERYAVWLATLTVIALAPAVEVAVRSMEPSDAAAPLAVMERGLSADWAPGAGEPEIEPRQQAVEAAPGPFLLLWLAVGVLFAVRLGRRCLMAAELKRNSTAPEAELADAVKAWERDLTARRVGATRVSLSLRSPAAVGWLSPAVLLPESAEDEVASDDLEMLWRHEQAHVARRDDWTQLWAEALFAAAWFHPAAYWVRRQLEKERELACDETVLDDGVPAHRYAGALGRWAERAATNELPAGVMGLGRSRALIIRRIEMLLSPSRILRRHSGGAVFGISLTLAVAAAGLLIFGGPTAIRAQSVVAPEVVVDVAQPVVAAPTVQPEVRIGVPAPVLRVDVQVEPVLLSQAAPPTPPSPQANPAPSAAPGPPVPPTPPRPSAAPGPPAPPTPPRPSAAPMPPVPPVPPLPPAPGREQSQEFHERARAMAEQARRLHEQLRPEIDEIQREAQRLQEYVRESIRPQQEKIQAAAQKLAEEHRKSIAPFAQEMAELGARMGQVFDSEQREALQKQMQEVAARMEERQPELKRLEEEMGRLQIDMGPFEERMKELSQALSKKHQEFEEARRKLKEANQ